MPRSVTSNPSRKRQHPESHPYNISRYQLKRQKLSKSASMYWDNLSKVWLTRHALKELDRRTLRMTYLLSPARFIKCTKCMECFERFLDLALVSMDSSAIILLFVACFRRANGIQSVRCFSGPSHPTLG
ncbi:uncharacterized protein PADG_11454 [Paracoccidioides brasiliensis Pb18]|uniref:Uncharacterized protein n=1 Tax=Paracoccidioides brasiliensis (strain Pb18) TaxID=502780 RepID=A0A0A0HSV9_PARBD|nr:uncharacterized protein PADG_11454 [Paracoccidioides brasiliensis Pb18]KGM92269.1 hypothetical protein PADG_11454 [Paracoccidioides brasiliensis Pb18]